MLFAEHRAIPASKVQIANGSLPGSTILQFAIFVLQVSIMLPSAARGEEPLVDREQAAIQAAADSLADSVVQIRTIGGFDSLRAAMLADGPTSGLVISPDGYVVSSAFNFIQQPASIVITFASGKQAPAELVATDHSRMLVLLKASGVADLPVPKFTPAADIRPGQWAIAVGRTFRPDRTNLSVGIVSAVGRMFGKVIQTDADVSTANYGGPLVDIHGQVLGLIVPIAPQGASQVAGAEWYDSGIGFAVPLASIADRLERMKTGEDQRPGILGVGLLPKNPHASPATAATVRPDSPAGRAGIKKGDRMIEVNGKPVRTQTDLRFALGPLYGGDTVRIVAKRGDERLERTVTLAGELPAFRHAYLGILPMRDAQPADVESKEDRQAAAANDGPAHQSDSTNGGSNGILVRMPCEGSPAAQAGIRPGDRILRINQSEIQSIDDAIQALNNVAPGGEVELRRAGQGEVASIRLTAARMPTTVPNELPPAYLKTTETPAQDGTIDELKMPEFPHTCKLYVPASHQAGRPQGILLWLHSSGEADTDELIADWRGICDRDSLLLVVPDSAESGGWERTELEFLRRLLERVVAQYKVDRRRVVVFGQQRGGAMAWLFGLSNREMLRGIATSASALPRQIRVPPNEPAQRLAVFASIPPGKDAAALQIADGLQKVSEAGYAVTTASAAWGSGLPTQAQRDELARWIDTLDRF
jgi:serine protease Do